MKIVCSNSDDIYFYLQDLVKSVDAQNIENIKRKWLYLILKWLYEKRNEIENIFEIVEEFYELFDFSESISSFVCYGRCMPSGDLDSIELNSKRLFKNWNDYLELFEETYSFGW